MRSMREIHAGVKNNSWTKFLTQARPEIETCLMNQNRVLSPDGSPWLSMPGIESGVKTKAGNMPSDNFQRSRMAERLLSCQWKISSGSSSTRVETLVVDCGRSSTAQSAVQPKASVNLKRIDVKDCRNVSLRKELATFPYKLKDASVQLPAKERASRQGGVVNSFPPEITLRLTSSTWVWPVILRSIR